MSDQQPPSDGPSDAPPKKRDAMTHAFRETFPHLPASLTDAKGEAVKWSARVAGLGAFAPLALGLPLRETIASAIIGGGASLLAEGKANELQQNLKEATADNPRPEKKVPTSDAPPLSREEQRAMPWFSRFTYLGPKAPGKIETRLTAVKDKVKSSIPDAPTATGIAAGVGAAGASATLLGNSGPETVAALLAAGGVGKIASAIHDRHERKKGRAPEGLDETAAAEALSAGERALTQEDDSPITPENSVFHPDSPQAAPDGPRPRGGQGR